MMMMMVMILNVEIHECTG